MGTSYEVDDQSWEKEMEVVASTPIKEPVAALAIHDEHVAAVTTTSLVLLKVHGGMIIECARSRLSAFVGAAEVRPAKVLFATHGKLLVCMLGGRVYVIHSLTLEQVVTSGSTDGSAVDVCVTDDGRACVCFGRQLRFYSLADMVQPYSTMLLKDRATSVQWMDDVVAVALPLARCYCILDAITGDERRRIPYRGLRTAPSIHVLPSSELVLRIRPSRLAIVDASGNTTRSTVSWSHSAAVTAVVFPLVLHIGADCIETYHLFRTAMATDSRPKKAPPALSSTDRKSVLVYGGDELTVLSRSHRDDPAVTDNFQRLSERFWQVSDAQEVHDELSILMRKQLIPHHGGSLGWMLADAVRVFEAEYGQDEGEGHGLGVLDESDDSDEDSDNDPAFSSGNDGDANRTRGSSLGGLVGSLGSVVAGASGIVAAGAHGVVAGVWGAQGVVRSTSWSKMARVVPITTPDADPDEEDKQLRSSAEATADASQQQADHLAKSMTAPAQPTALDQALRQNDLVIQRSQQQINDLMKSDATPLEKSQRGAELRLAMLRRCAENTQKAISSGAPDHKEDKSAAAGFQADASSSEAASKPQHRSHVGKNVAVASDGDDESANSTVALVERQAVRWWSWKDLHKRSSFLGSSGAVLELGELWGVSPDAPNAADGDVAFEEKPAMRTDSGSVASDDEAGKHTEQGKGVPEAEADPIQLQAQVPVDVQVQSKDTGDDEQKEQQMDQKEPGQPGGLVVTDDTIRQDSHDDKAGIAADKLGVGEGHEDKVPSVGDGMVQEQHEKGAVATIGENESSHDAHLAHGAVSLEKDEGLEKIIGQAIAGVEEISRRIHKTLLHMYPVLRSAALSQTCLDTIQVEHLRAVNATLMSLYVRRHASDDFRLAAVQRLRSVSLRSFEVAKAFVLPDGGYQPAIHAIEKLQEARDPQSKLACVINTTHEIGACAFRHQTKQGLQRTPMGADDMLPVFCYVVANSRASQLHAHCAYLLDLIPDDKLLGEGGYALATLQTALHALVPREDGMDDALGLEGGGEDGANDNAQSAEGGIAAENGAIRSMKELGARIRMLGVGLREGIDFLSSGAQQKKSLTADTTAQAAAQPHFNCFGPSGMRGCLYVMPDHFKWDVHPLYFHSREIAIKFHDIEALENTRNLLMESLMVHTVDGRTISFTHVARRSDAMDVLIKAAAENGHHSIKVIT